MSRNAHPKTAQTLLTARQIICGQDKINHCTTGKIWGLRWGYVLGTVIDLPIFGLEGLNPCPVGGCQVVKGWGAAILAPLEAASSCEGLGGPKSLSS